MNPPDGITGVMILLLVICCIYLIASIMRGGRSNTYINHTEDAIEAGCGCTGCAIALLLPISATVFFVTMTVQAWTGG